MFVINSKMKKKKNIKIDQIDKVVDRCFLIYSNWAFLNRETHPFLTLLDI